MGWVPPDFMAQAQQGLATDGFIEPFKAHQELLKLDEPIVVHLDEDFFLYFFPGP